MKKSRATLCVVLLSLLIIVIILALVVVGVASIRFAVILLEFLSVVVKNAVRITIEVMTALVLLTLLLMFIYHTFLDKFIHASSKADLCTAPVRMRKLFYDRKFTDRKINVLRDKVTLLLDKKDETCNAYAYKNNSIVITNGFNNSPINDSEKKAVLFHEFAHLINKDNHKKYIRSGINRFIILFFMLSTAFFYVISICAMLYSAPYAEKSFLYMLSLFNGMIEFFIFTLCHLIDFAIELLDSWKSRKAEYEADRFAAYLGLKDPLISFFNKFEKAKGSRYDFFDTHPSIAKRINALENFTQCDLIIKYGGFMKFADYKLDEIQPSQFYISSQKISRVEEWFDKNDMSKFEPIPIKILDGVPVMTDGHMRAVVAIRAGLDKVPVVYDEDELDWEMYREYVKACRKRNIASPYDLLNRVIPHDAYVTEWIGWCEALQRSSTEKNRIGS